MLSSVTINCQVTKIVMNSGSQLWEENGGLLAIALFHFQVRFNSISTLPPKTLVALRAVTRDSVVKQCCIALGKGDGELLEEVAYGGRLLLPCVAGEAAAQLLDLADG